MLIGSIVLGTCSSILGTRSSFLGTRSSFLGTLSSFLGTRSSFLGRISSGDLFENFTEFGFLGQPSVSEVRVESTLFDFISIGFIVGLRRLLLVVVSVMDVVESVAVVPFSGPCNLLLLLLLLLLSL